MQASSAKEPFDSSDWIFETKLDGYRAIAVIDSNGKARIWSRNRLPLEQKFPTIRDATEELNLRSTILDGEIVALDEKGIPRFQLLQKWQKRPTAPVVYVLFDLLWDNARDLTAKSIDYRRLQEIISLLYFTAVSGKRPPATVPLGVPPDRNFSENRFCKRNPFLGSAALKPDSAFNCFSA